VVPLKSLTLTKNNGFTLIEVLLALLICAISLTAIIQASSSTVQNTERLRDLTYAHWVAFNGIELIQLGLVKFSANGQPINQVTKLLGRKWYWQAQLTNSNYPKVKKIIVRVKKNARGPYITSVMSYLLIKGGTDA
jgi:general secretion pathway protein I